MDQSLETAQDIVEYKLNPIINERFPNFDKMSKIYQTEIIYGACLSIVYPPYKQYIDKKTIYEWYHKHSKSFKGG